MKSPNWSRWLAPGVGIKRWLALLLAGIVGVVLAAVLRVYQTLDQVSTAWQSSPLIPLLLLLLGIVTIIVALRALAFAVTQPYTRSVDNVSDALISFKQRQRGPRVVAIGGGTGLPAALRALKTQTNDLTAVVTVADDGGSSGRLRRVMGVLPPGDLRNNIVALADDESLMAKLFQYRFERGELKGHSFGNLFISVLASITEGGLETALIETARVLNIQGRVLPSTLEDVNLRANVRLPGKTHSMTIFGEAAIGEAGGKIERLEIVPKDATGYPGSVDAILNAEMVVIGPGSLYTSIIPNLLVPDIANALRATTAYIVYICNVATQPGETDNYTVAEHMMAIEEMVGRGVFQATIANNAYPPPPANSNTHYVRPVPQNHQVMQRYEIVYADLTDSERPWRHDPNKLSTVLMALYEHERYGKPLPIEHFAEATKTG